MLRYYYYLLEGRGFIRICTNRKPKAQPRPYILREFDGLKWVMPTFPEIPYSSLKNMRYIGSEPVSPAPQKGKEE